MDDFVEVIDVRVVTTVPGVTLQHTIRPHEGETIAETPNGDLCVKYAEREVRVGGDLRKTPGVVATIAGAHIVELTKTTRWEPRVRPSVAHLLNRDVHELAAKLAGAGTTIPAVTPTR